MPRAPIAGPWRPRTRPGSSCCAPPEVAGTPPPYLKALAVGSDAPGAPAHLAIEPYGERSSQTWSYSRTTARPPPRSSRVEPRSTRGAGRAPAAPSSARPGGADCLRGRVQLAEQRQDLSRISPRFVSGFDVSAGTRDPRRGSTPRCRRASGRGAGRTTPSARVGSIRRSAPTRRCGRGRSRPGRRPYGPSRAADPSRTVADARAARPRSCRRSRRRPRRRAPRGRTPRPPPTRRRAARGATWSAETS